MHLPADSGDRVERAIAQAEELTSVEIVLRARPFSGSYRDTEYLFGALLALVELAYALFGAAVVPSVWVLPSCVGAFLVGWGVCRSSPHLKRLLTTRARRSRQAHAAAGLAFLAQGVDCTRERTGLLIHVSFLERSVELVADRALAAEITAAELSAYADELRVAMRQGDPVSALCARLVLLGEELGEWFPPGEDNPDELSNVPVLDDDW